MGYDKRFKRFQEFVEDTGSRPMGSFAYPERYQRCADCDGSGKSYPEAQGWNDSNSWVRGMGWSKKQTCATCQGTGQSLKEDVPPGGYVWELQKCLRCGSIFGPAHAVSKTCPNCGSTNTIQTNEPLMKRLKREDAAVGVPANAAGNAGVAGIGQPPGSKFGEPGGRRGRLKHFNEWDQTPKPIEGGGQVTEASGRPSNGFAPNPFEKILTKYGFEFYSSSVEPNRFAHDPKNDVERHIWKRLPGRSHVEVWMYRDGDKSWIARYEQPNGIMSPTTGGTKGQLDRALAYDFSPVTEATDAEIEKAAKEVHDRWVKSQKELGETEHTSPDGKEDYMVPYHKLSDDSKDMDRGAVQATLDALGMSEAKILPFPEHCSKCGTKLHTTGTGRKWCRKCGVYDRPLFIDGVSESHKRYERQECAACEHGSSYNETCVRCGGAGYMYFDTKTREHLYAGEVEDDKDIDPKDIQEELTVKKVQTGTRFVPGKPNPTCSLCGGTGYASKERHGFPFPLGKFSSQCQCTAGKEEPVYKYVDVKEERETFAGSPVFNVDTDKWMKSRFGKNRYHRYSRYVGEDDSGEEIRQHGRTQRKDDIILKDQTTGAMTYFLRRKKSAK